MVLHSLRTNAGISLSVVDELVSISSMASMISSGENLISQILAEVRILLGEVLSVLFGPLNTDLYCYCKIFAISRGLLVREPSLVKGPTLDL